jgi:outer membrane immunogenic protein
MRRTSTIYAAILALGGTIGPVCAADLPEMPVKSAPLAPPLPWYGSFIGGSAGYAFGHDPVTFEGATGLVAPGLGAIVPFNIAANPSGFVGGIQYGSNWQTGRFVYGTLSDFSYSDVRASQTAIFATPALGTRATVAEQSLAWFSTSRLRGGYLINDNLLLYASGGLASGRASINATNFAPGVACVTGGACLFGNDAQTRFGWAAGLGAEYRMGPWSMTFDWVHYDLGRLTVSLIDLPAISSFSTSTRLTGDVMRGGIVYHFKETFWDMVFGRR